MTADFLFVSNDKYVKYLGISSYSVLHNMCPAVEKVRIFVMDCGITEENRQRLLRQTARFDNAEMIFFDIDKKLDAVTPKEKSRWHRAIYGRLFLPEIVKLYKDIDRMIYLDCDLLMDRPVTELFTMPLDGKCLAGVSDSETVNRRNVLGITDPAGIYINSGVLVIDTARWVELDASRRIIEYINSFPEELLFPDQDAINYILQGEIVLIDIRYNMLSMVTYEDAWKMAHYAFGYAYTEMETYRALYQGSIYHFAGHDMFAVTEMGPMHRMKFMKYYKLCDWNKEPLNVGGFKKRLNWFAVSVKRLLTLEGLRNRLMMKKSFPENGPRIIR